VKKFLPLLLVLIFAGCFSKPPAPQWVTNAPQDNQEFFYAAEDGYSKDNAIKKALSDIASRLNVSISSELLVNQGVFDNEAYTEINQQISSKVADIQFNNYKVVKFKQIGDDNYVLIKVNKSKLRQQIKTQIDDSLNKIQILLNHWADALQKVQNAHKAIKLIKKTNTKLLILQTLGADVSKSMKKLEKYLKQANYALQHTKFSVKVNNFKQRTLDVMSKYFVISSKGNRIRVSISLKKKYILRQFLIIGKANISFQGHKTITIRFKGSSYTGTKNAIFKAGEDFKNKLDSTIKNLLGV